MQPPEAPPEAKEWAQNTVIGVLFGIMYGGGKQWLTDRAAGEPLLRGTSKCLMRLQESIQVPVVDASFACSCAESAARPAVQAARGQIRGRHTDRPAAGPAQSVHQVLLSRHVLCSLVRCCRGCSSCSDMATLLGAGAARPSAALQPSSTRRRFSAASRAEGATTETSWPQGSPPDVPLAS